MADIFHEVDQDLRAERWRRLWRRYGLYAFILAASVVLGTAGYALWRDHRNQRLDDSSQRFAQALALAQAGERSSAGAELTLLGQDGAGGYPLLARLAQATIEREAGEIDKALATYDTIAADREVAAEFRDFALLQAAYLQVDREPRARFVDRVQNLSTGSGPWRFAARELIGLAAIKAGDREDARKIFTELADDAATPKGVRARASELLAALGM